MGYQVATVYNLSSYAGAQGLNRPGLFLAGASLSIPVGSNLPVPSAVGRYGSFVGASGTNNFAAHATHTESKQLPMRVGKGVILVSFADNTRGGVGPLIPAYGN